MYTEAHAAPAPKEKKTAEQQKSSLGLWSTGWMRTLTEGLQNFKETVTSPRKKHRIWTSQPYFDAMALSTEAPQQELVLNQITANLESFFDEFAFLRAAVTYEYGPNGIRNGYGQSMSEVALNFLNYLKSVGAPIERAELELHVALYVEAWMNSPKIKKGEKLVFISPRGSEAEFYPGLDERNLVFLNIFEKTEKGFLLHQYRNYDPNKKLPELQERITAAGHGFTQRISSLYQGHPDHGTITTAIHLPATTPISTITTENYRHKASWRMDIDKQLPSLSEAALKEQATAAIAFCCQEFVAMNHESLSQAEKSEAFDLLIEIVLNDLRKWAENAASNYDPQKQVEYAINLELDKQAWLIKRKKAKNEEISTEEKSLLQSVQSLTKLNPALPLSRAASFAHCIIGTPTSLLKLQALAPGNMLNVSGFSMEGSLFAQMSPEERAHLRNELQQYVRVELNGEVWFVPPDYLTGKGCYIDPETGVAMGPCGIPLDDPREGYAMRAEKYFQLLESLKEAAMPEELVGLSNNEQTEAINLFSLICKHILVSTTSLEKILLNDVVDTRRKLPPQLEKVRKQVASSLDPIQTLLLTIVELYKYREKEKIEELEMELKNPTLHFSMN